MHSQVLSICYPFYDASTGYGTGPIVTFLFQKGTQASTKWLSNLLTDMQVLFKPNTLISEPGLLCSDSHCLLHMSTVRVLHISALLWKRRRFHLLVELKSFWRGCIFFPWKKKEKQRLITYITTSLIPPGPPISYTRQGQRKNKPGYQQIQVKFELVLDPPFVASSRCSFQTTACD